MCVKVQKINVTLQGMLICNLFAYGFIYTFFLFVLIFFYFSNILTGFILIYTLDTSSYLELVMNSVSESFGGGSGGSSGGNPNPGSNPTGLEGLVDNRNNKEKPHDIYGEIADWLEKHCLDEIKRRESLGIKSKSVTFGEIGLNFSKKDNDQYEIASTINEALDHKVNRGFTITSDRLKQIREFGNK